MIRKSRKKDFEFFDLLIIHGDDVAMGTDLEVGRLIDMLQVINQGI